MNFWLDLVKEETSINLIVVGNKADLDKDRKVSIEEGQEYANKINAKFYETSAENSQNLEEMFEEVGHILAKLTPAFDPAADSSVIDLRPIHSSKPSNCNCKC